VEEPAAAGRGDRERGGDDGEGCGDPGEAQEGLERGPVARPHAVRGRRASRDAGTGARCGNETRRRGGRVCALECGGGNRREHRGKKARKFWVSFASRGGEVLDQFLPKAGGPGVKVPCPASGFFFRCKIASLYPFSKVDLFSS
jgi:hypothetical protein